MVLLYSIIILVGVGFIVAGVHQVWQARRTPDTDMTAAIGLALIFALVGVVAIAIGISILSGNYFGAA